MYKNIATEQELQVIMKTLNDDVATNITFAYIEKVLGPILLYKTAAKKVIVSCKICKINNGFFSY